MPCRVPVERVLRLARDILREPDINGVVAVRSRPKRSPHGLSIPPGAGPLHFSRYIWELCEDIVRKTPELAHIDMHRILVTFSRCRNDRSWGLQAKLVPLRFRGGHRIEFRRGHRYQVQQIYVGETELLYVLTFYLPRFLNQTFAEKMITIFHELYHVGPEFTGDIRRFEGVRSHHHRSRRQYDEQMARLARRYLSEKPPPRLHDLLRRSFDELESRFGAIVGVQIPAPKLIPVGTVGTAAARKSSGSV